MSMLPLNYSHCLLRNILIHHTESDTDVSKFLNLFYFWDNTNIHNKVKIILILIRLFSKALICLPESSKIGKISSYKKIWTDSPWLKNWYRNFKLGRTLLNETAFFFHSKENVTTNFFKKYFHEKMYFFKYCCQKKAFPTLAHQYLRYKILLLWKMRISNTPDTLKKM